MTFLKKLGSYATKALGLFSVFTSSGLLSNVYKPGSTADVVVDKLDAGLQTIVTAEQMFTAAFGADAKNGSDKLRAVIPYISTLIQQSQVVAGKKIHDEAGFEAAVAKIAGGFADALNAFGD